MAKQFRQGDVLVIRTDDDPEAFLKQAPHSSRRLRPVKNLVLAEGEVTGHKHEVVTEDRSIISLPSDNPNIDDIFVLTETGIFRHPEHTPPMELDKGVYQVRRQREHEPELESHERRVAD